MSCVFAIALWSCTSRTRTEELLLVPDEMPVGGVGEFVEDDMVRDAFDLEDE